MASPGVGVPADTHVVGRIQERRVDPDPCAYHRLQERCVAAVAAADPMIAKDPDITRRGARDLRHRRDRLVVRIRRAFQRDVNLAGREPRGRQVNLECCQLTQLQFQQLGVPAGVQGNLVVGQPKCPLLGIAKTFKNDGRHLGKRHGLGGKQAPMPGNDRPVRVDQDRVGEPELPDRGHDLFDLAWRVRARIVRAGNEAAERPVSDAEWAFADRLGRVIHECNFIERSNNIKHIKDIRLGWTCHANRASMGSSPAPGLSAVAAATRPVPDQETTMTKDPRTATAAHRPQRKARAHPQSTPALPLTRLDPLATLLSQREGAR